MAFKDKLKQARKVKGLTQTELGNIIGVGKSTIAGYESGKREPDIDKIHGIILALDIDANYLWQDDLENTRIKKTSVSAKTETEDRKLIKLFYELFVKAGYVKNGDDFTLRQAEAVAGMIRIVRSTVISDDISSAS